MARITSSSNKGGPAARQGFKYQDHVAVSFIIKMLRDNDCTHVECETADDIVAVSGSDGNKVFEYIQVKTTEGDKKWNWQEATNLDNNKKESSLLQKSLKCDSREGLARFRMVTKRDVASILEGFKKELSQRILPDETSARGAALLKKFKNFKSTKNRDFSYWASNFVWQVCGDMDALAARNINGFSQLAEQYGNRPSHRQLECIYEKFLEIADSAATADVKTKSSEKIIHREATLAFLRKELDDADLAATTTSKPYKNKPEPFLKEFHASSEPLRSVAAFDVQYSLGKWRSDDFAKHLIEWMPEFSLKAREIVNFQLHNAAALIARSVSNFSETQLCKDRLIAELILHAILRTREESEPIACKVFFKKDGKLSNFGNAHIVKGQDKDDQLWLGQGRLVKAQAVESTLKQICKILDSTISKIPLSTEREIIISLREPQHHLPKSEKFNSALLKNSPVDEMLGVLCFPILLTYDSDVLAPGRIRNHIKQLEPEILSHYATLKQNLSNKVKEVAIVFFLVPMESVTQLINEFNVNCKTH